MLEKPVAQNITACKNQGKSCKLSDHWKSIDDTKQGMTQKRQKDGLKYKFSQK